MDALTTRFAKRLNKLLKDADGEVSHKLVADPKSGTLSLKLRKTTPENYFPEKFACPACGAEEEYSSSDFESEKLYIFQCLQCGKETKVQFED
jgi:uncharacterized OB-fold protein